jgi:hypothetical protein
MSNGDVKTFTIEDAKFGFRNFRGSPGKFNKEGERSFGIILPEDIAEDLLADGWTVKRPKPTEGSDEPKDPYIPIKVRFDKRPPRIVLLTATTRTQLDEASLEVLDWADVKTVDLIARGSWYDVNGKTGWSAYLQTMFVTVEEDALEKKYSYYEELSQQEEPF